jgi:hypothetical protein
MKLKKPTWLPPARLFIAVTIAFALVGIHQDLVDARPAINGERCTVEGSVVRVKKSAYTCVRRGKRLRWQANSSATGSAAGNTTGTTTTSVKLPFGYPFVMPSQYASREFLGDVFVSSQSVKRGQSINVLVKLSFAGLGQTYQLDQSSTLAEIMSSCRSLIGVGTDLTPPFPAWTTNVAVSLIGTAVSGGGPTQFVIVGNVIQDCGTALVKTSPPQIGVERWSMYQDIGIRLDIPATLPARTYDLILKQIGNPWTKQSPIKITVTE